MTQTAVLSDSKYQKLISDLKRIIQAGRKRGKEAVARENVQMYWEVGKRITQEEMTPNAGYRDTIQEDIADDLGLDVTTIGQSVLFFSAYSESAPGGRNLFWAHYRELALIKDDQQRDWYEEKAEAEGWIRNQLVRAIKRNAYADTIKKGARRDGFKTRPYELKRPIDASYVYKAEVLRAIDGDTLLVRFDLGFTVEKRQRIRLADIDCAEKDTKKGFKAFEFVRDALAGVPFVVIKTNKVDLHGRYVGHVFYTAQEKKIEKVFENGKYLSQELLSRGLAKRV